MAKLINIQDVNCTQKLIPDSEKEFKFLNGTIKVYPKVKVLKNIEIYMRP